MLPAQHLMKSCSAVPSDSNSFGCVISVLTVGKPTILMVMHHTVDRNQVVAESRRLVNNPNVHLTVDVLLHKGKITKCDQNRKAWFDFVMFLAASFRSNNKKVRTSFTDMMQPSLHIINFSSELAV